MTMHRPILPRLMGGALDDTDISCMSSLPVSSGIGSQVSKRVIIAIIAVLTL